MCHLNATAAPSLATFVATQHAMVAYLALTNLFLHSHLRSFQQTMPPCTQLKLDLVLHLHGEVSKYLEAA